MRVVFCFLLLVLSFKCSVGHASQHPVVVSIIKQFPKCGPDYFYSNSEIKSNEVFNEGLQTLAKSKYLKSERLIRVNQVKSLNLFPVNECVLRGNRQYFKPEYSELLADFEIDTAITMDATVNKKNQKAGRTNYIYSPIIPKTYPKGESVSSILTVLNHLSKASPEQKVFISCYFGKHRTGLIVGLYQFLRNYAKDPVDTCLNAYSAKDKSYEQMKAIAAVGRLTYDMPVGYLEFYRDFAESVCQNRSNEFLQNLLK